MADRNPEAVIDAILAIPELPEKARSRMTWLLMQFRYTAPEQQRDVWMMGAEILWQELGPSGGVAWKQKVQDIYTGKISVEEPAVPVPASGVTPDGAVVHGTPEEAKLKEALAARAHDAWSDWMEYLFSRSEEDDDGTVIIPRDQVERWRRQMKADYKDLSKEEQVSDLIEADKYMAVLQDCRPDAASMKIGHLDMDEVSDRVEHGGTFDCVEVAELLTEIERLRGLGCVCYRYDAKKVAEYNQLGWCYFCGKPAGKTHYDRHCPITRMRLPSVPVCDSCIGKRP